MTDLHDKARALLTLRENATPGPWLAAGDVISAPHPKNDGRTCWLAARVEAPGMRIDQCRANQSLMTAAHDMADTIAALLAENERLAAGWQATRQLAEEADAARIDAHARAEAAEAGYAALCEAEPVAVIHADGYWTHPAGQDPFDHYKTNATRLEVIPRPSMEGKANGRRNEVRLR